MNAQASSICLLMCAAVLVGVAGGCSSFQHVAAGQSVLVAQAKKPVVIATPTPIPQYQPSALYAMHEVAPDLPRSEPLPPSSMADFFALGNSLLQEGKNAEAAGAFKKATELDPSYPEAWHNLALSYESAGDEADAVEAFRRYKNLPSQQP